MRFFKLFFLVLFTFICNAAFAVTFIVTSNADSGPGTLRQALLDAAANGTLPTDIITFNLPGTGQAAITITLQTQLPDVSANLIIDGTTQPGAFLGVSNAKIIITPATPAANFNGFNVSASVNPGDQVAFYGLCIMGFSPNQAGLGHGIVTNANCNLIIGAPGKGNIISGNNFAFLGYFQNAVIQSNFIGVAPDGVTPFNNSSVLYSAQDYNGLLIGGALQTDGNVILGGGTSGINFGGAVNGVTKSVTIQNNYFNTDYTGTKSINSANNSCILVNDANSTINVISNIFSASEVGVAAANASSIVVKGNYFGIDKTQAFPLGSGTQAIDENTNVNAVIGGTTPADQNVFTNYQNPILAFGCTTNVIENMFYCNATVQLNDLNGGTNFIRITTLTATSVAGDAPAGATVQLYNTATKCNSCNPNQWFATVTANGSGKWQYNGPTVQNVLASSTVNNNTVGFQIDALSQSEVTIVNYDCHHGGSISLNEPRLGEFQMLWTDSNGQLVGNGQSISNLQPGTYNLQISENGACPSVSNSFTVIDLTSHVYPSTFQLNCSQPTGYFTAYPGTVSGITVTNYYWSDANGNIISTTNKVTNLAAGSYYLYITDSNGCNSAPALFQVLAAAPPPVIDASNAVITDATCNLANGSITGLVLTNAVGANYTWYNTNGTALSYNNTNLINAPAGQYYLQVNYNFNCPPVKSAIFTINEKNVITMDESAVVTSSASCTNSNGSITGIVVTGATQYQWFNASNQIAGNGADLLNAPSGNYYLVASNSTCSKQSAVYTIGNIPAFKNYQSTYTSTDAYCSSNGSITVTFDPNLTPAAYIWLTPGGVEVGNSNVLTNQPAGTYQLYVTDNNQCQSYYNSYSINEIPQLQVVPGSAQVNDDQCLQGTGSITNILINGGIPPYTYNWTNALGQSITTNLNLTGITPGIYTLQVKDATACDIATLDYAVGNTTEPISSPTANNVQVCSAGEIVIAVNNVQAGYGYHLYDSNISSNILQDAPNGMFKVPVSGTRSYFITQYLGNCESARTEVLVTVGATDISIPNAFTPNNDGINDYWDIKGIENYPNAVVQVFNRYGQKVFESKGYGNPFNGTLGGNNLPVGVYYYIINLKSNCSLLSGSLTLLR
ncbi:gliding motility-associated-like protein [Mucilaginibacter frigoritolerans]|uniref:Gliding motility-associated-like protein n=1 Tax=Mucilaginibacter frigoritolerans TaxID=652788 RepID=A0A562UAF4_9SPHI|nr:gliding motility-associated C-terminal domain-containing protein [Mucilaginibacter frigoritolerans]TWJ02255.1 gliding motility-associated-like protein [Mucilaginibacter frigoritolerans]